MTDIARGLEGVVLAETRLSQVDGQAGKLTIAGFPLEELAPNATFEETLHLMWYGRLPRQAELDALADELGQARSLPAITVEVMRSCAQKRMPPMDALRMAVDTLSLVDAAAEEQGRPANLRRAVALAARMPTIIGGYARLLEGKALVEPRADLSHAGYFLYQRTGEEADPAAVRGLETYLNAVVDHGMNASTFTARVIVSTRSDLVSAVVGAIGALKGPLHGGAPGPALDTVFMLRRQAADQGVRLEQVAEDWARQTIEAGDRIMGFGHRVYKVRDPRADVLAAAAARLFERTGDQALYDDARVVEKVFIAVLQDLKPGRNLSTNVEFYTALLLHGLGLESAIFSSIFAMARVGGWTAHILEQMEDNVLIRPRAKYVGEHNQKWVALAERG